ncbi:hypothetical protein ACHAQA_006540 [Verticillium albo-atrum]
MESQHSAPMDDLQGNPTSNNADTATPGSSLEVNAKSDIKGDAALSTRKALKAKKGKKKSCKKLAKKKKKNKNKKSEESDSVTEDSSTSDSDSDSSANDTSFLDESDSSEEDEPRKRRLRSRLTEKTSKKSTKAAKKNIKKTRVKSPEPDFSAADSDSDDDASAAEDDDDNGDDSDDGKTPAASPQGLTASQLQAVTAAVSQVLALQSRTSLGTSQAAQGLGPLFSGQVIYNSPVPGDSATTGIPLPKKPQVPIPKPNLVDASDKKKKKKVKKEAVIPDRLEYKRVDQIWDSVLHNFKLQSTKEGDSGAQYDAFVLQIRRVFDFEGKYKSTTVDVKSKLLRECLQDVIGNIRGVSLVDNTPRLDPNLLFFLYPMLENGLITFDLLWALWKPDTLAYTTTYGSENEPRVFKVEAAEKHSSFVKGDFYYVEGKYFEYDGKQFGYGGFGEEIADFRGARKITSLSCYPLSYHKNEQQVRKDLIERGKKFVQLGGVHYKGHEGMAYYKKKKTTVKININGRIMVDPSIHRRCNPNYPVPMVRVKDHDLISEDEDEDEDEDQDGSGCGCADDSDSDKGGCGSDSEDNKTPEYVKKVYQDEKGELHVMHIPKEMIEEQADIANLEAVERTAAATEGVPSGEEEAEFSDEEYLLASPVVLGFSFGEKMWLEFSVSGVKEIQWNEKAYESLVLQEKPKAIVKALVESHKYHGAENIDDVIQGKGKGLVAVLHGPPGTGKTLTAEGISELLKCPLYMASAGELSTDPRYLETELQKILDICHAWGAILLLDEADVFLEKRNMHDIHRNALVSIFLRQLEYFQGILFLTTNRVETFDDAFQSRIHVALRYDKLSTKAKRSIFEIFIERVRAIEKKNSTNFTEEDYDHLTKFDLNGRQIKNTIRTAQALATNKKESLSMVHIKDVLEVQRSFEQDLKGGTGYEDAMRAYQ